MSNEIERLNQLLKQRMNELDEWKSRYSNIESSLISSEVKKKIFKFITKIKILFIFFPV
jgi:hypothetical protein